MKKILIPIVILAAAAGTYLWQQQTPADDPNHLTLFGNVDVRQVSLAFEGSGRVLTLNVEEGDPVHQGQPLATLDTRLLALQVDEVTATIDEARQALAKLRNGARPQEIAQARSQLQATSTQAGQARRDYQRLQDIFETSRGSVSQADVDKAHSALQIAEAQRNQAQQALDLLLAGARQEDIASAEARIRMLEANQALLQLQIERGQLLAPADAVVRSRLLEVGDMASPSRAVYSLALTTPKRIKVYLPETRLGQVHPGMRAQIITDSHPDQPVAGTLVYLSSTAEFTPKAIQTEELRSSLVYEARIQADDPDQRLQLGQPVTVTLDLQSAAAAAAPAAQSDR